jgi:hypothetical protein
MRRWFWGAYRPRSQFDGGCGASRSWAVGHGDAGLDVAHGVAWFAGIELPADTVASIS